MYRRVPQASQPRDQREHVLGRRGLRPRAAEGAGGGPGAPHGRHAGARHARLAPARLEEYYC